MHIAKLALMFVVGLCFVVPAHAQNVKFNEVNTLLDYIEICNLDDVNPADISGWYCVYTEDTQNPLGSTFQFPGIAGSGTTVLGPNECIILTDSATFAHPIVPVGTQVLFFGLNILWNAGEAGSALIADDLGNGVDYYAHGNPNLMGTVGFGAPFEYGTTLFGVPALPTAWTGVASPSSGAPNSLDVHKRHSRTDTDTANDWSMAASGSDSPGTVNPFQLTPGSPQYTGAAPVAAFSLNTTGGTPPLVVNASNTSTSELELTLILWDFDATANPGVNIYNSFNASHTYAGAGSYDVTLNIQDSLGISSSAGPTTVTAAFPAVAPVTTLPYTEDFEGTALDPATGLTALGANGWTYDGLMPTSRCRTADIGTIGAIAGTTNASPSSGPTVAVMDSSLNGNFATNELSLHIDMLATGDFRLIYWAYENLDESHPQDAFVITDGVTLGNGVNSGGASSGAPGAGGYQEVMLTDTGSSAVLPNRTWVEFSHIIDAAFMISNGLVPSNDVRIVFRQHDNFMFNGGDGVMIDEIRVLPPAVAGAGQPGDPAIASMDINNATNANGNPVGTPGDLAGPHFASASVGGNISFTFSGEANSGIILLTGPLNVGLQSFPGIGQFDIGSAAGPIPAGITVIADGFSGTGFINSMFNTGPNGSTVISFGTPNLAPGVLGSFQAAIANSQTVAAMTNAVELTIN